MSNQDLDPDKLREQMLKSSQSTDVNGKVIWYVDKALVEEIVDYCTKQFNDASVRSKLGYEEYAALTQEAIQGLYMLVYIKHYKDGENLLEKQPTFIAAQNWLHLMYKSLIGGHFGEMIVKENVSRNPPQLRVA
jgi:hypothetical protein